MSELSPDIIIFPATESTQVLSEEGGVGGKSYPKDPSSGSEWNGQRTFVTGVGQPRNKGDEGQAGLEPLARNWPLG